MLSRKSKKASVFTHCLVLFFVAGYSCGGLRTQVAGVISSSNFPYYYKSNTSCVWKISVNTANQITLNFTDFELENSSRCEHAYVQVFDGPNTTDPSLGIFCGSKMPTGARSSGNQMLVVFHAYSGNNFKGFRAYYDSGKLIRRIFFFFFRWLMTLEVDNWRNILSITICSFSKWLRQPEGLQIHLQAYHLLTDQMLIDKFKPLFLGDCRVRSYGGNGGGACCVFPFIYKGRLYHECTEEDADKDAWGDRWCSVTGNYDRDKKRGHCVSENGELFFFTSFALISDLTNS